MIVRFQKENLLLEAEDTLISVGGLGISPRQALTVFGIKKRLNMVEREQNRRNFPSAFSRDERVFCKIPGKKKKNDMQSRTEELPSLSEHGKLLTYIGKEIDTKY